MYFDWKQCCTEEKYKLSMYPYKILIETSPLDVKSDEQYSMQNLFECIFTKYIV